MPSKSSECVSLHWPPSAETTTSHAKRSLSFGQEGRELRAADLLLALEEALDVDGEPARGREQRLEREDGHQHVALVVGGAARVDAAVLDHRLERRRGPLGDRIDRLDVEVAVDQDGRGGGAGVQPVCRHHRMAAGR